MNIIKFGGSVITDKTTECCFKQDIMDRLSNELHKAKQEFILVTGAGSFGHIQAKKYSLTDGYTAPSQLLGFTLTHMMVQKLNSLVLNSLYDHDIPAVGLPPHAFLTLDKHQPRNNEFSLFDQYIKLGFTPVTYGDVVLDESLGFSICSGDLLLELLAVYYKPEKVIFVMDENGLYTSNPKTDPNAELIKQITIKELSDFTTTANTYADVTKGMEGKIDTIRHIGQAGIDTYLLNGNFDNRLYHTLLGKNTTHTHIVGENQ
jgi:isopentenyl phosphate kinase